MASQRPLQSSWFQKAVFYLLMQEGVNFAVYASSATSVSLCLFTEADLQAGRVTHEVPLSPELNRTGYIWHILLPSLDSSLLYGRSNGAHTCTLPVPA